MKGKIVIEINNYTISITDENGNYTEFDIDGNLTDLTLGDLFEIMNDND